MTIDENKQIVKRAFEALTAGDLAPLEGLLAPNAVIHQCGFLEPIPAQALFRGEWPRSGPLVDRRVRLERMIGEGDIVSLHWWTAGRHADPDEPEIDGAEVSFPSMTFVRVENRRIAEIWNIQDIATMQSQVRAAAEPVASG